ncbi:MAG: hypothetical protein WC393_04055 [Candidatus Nanoarchaeia archaeon]|jgi:hypothetical protein
MNNNSLIEIFEETVTTYEKAGLDFEKSDIKYFIEKTKPDSMISVAAMTYLMVDNQTLDSMSNYFGINKFFILNETLNLEEESVQLLTNESKESLVKRKVLNKDNYVSLIETFEAKYSHELEELSSLHTMISVYTGGFPKEEIIKAFASTEQGMGECENLIKLLFSKNKQKCINDILDILNAQNLVSKKYPDNKEWFYFLTKEYQRRIKEI